MRGQSINDHSINQKHSKFVIFSGLFVKLKTFQYKYFYYFFKNRFHILHKMLEISDFVECIENTTNLCEFSDELWDVKTFRKFFHNLRARNDESSFSPAEIETTGRSGRPTSGSGSDPPWASSVARAPVWRDWDRPKFWPPWTGLDCPEQLEAVAVVVAAAAAHRACFFRPGSSPGAFQANPEPLSETGRLGSGLRRCLDSWHWWACPGGSGPYHPGYENFSASFDSFGYFNCEHFL